MLVGPRQSPTEAQSTLPTTYKRSPTTLDISKRNETLKRQRNSVKYIEEKPQTYFDMVAGCAAPGKTGPFDEFPVRDGPSLPLLIFSTDKPAA